MSEFSAYLHNLKYNQNTSQLIQSFIILFIQQVLGKINLRCPRGTQFEDQQYSVQNSAQEEFS